MDNVNGKYNGAHKSLCDYARFFIRTLGCDCMYHPRYQKYLDNLAILSIEDRLFYWFFFPFEGEQICAVCESCLAVMGYEKLSDELEDWRKHPVRDKIGYETTYREPDYDHITARLVVGSCLANGSTVMAFDQVDDYEPEDLDSETPEILARWKVIALRRVGDFHAYTCWLVTADHDGWSFYRRDRSNNIKMLIHWLYDDLQL